MSIQAVAWALEQEDIPARPKLVLVSLANHANHVDGYCWLKAETIAAEASCKKRSVYRFVGDLIRNGYVRKEHRRGDDGKQRANDYWLTFNREPTKWVSIGAPEGEDSATDDDESETQDVVGETEPGASLSPGPGVVPQHPAEGDEIPSLSPGPGDSAGTHKDSAEPSKIKPEEGRAPGYVPRAYHPPPPPPPQPVGSIAGAKAEMIFVFDGTPAYEAWARQQARKNGINKWHCLTTKVVDGQQRRGWYFPTLFPPKANNNSGSDPPSDSLATEEELNQFGKTG